MRRSIFTAFLLVLFAATAVHSRKGVAAPVRPGEKSSADWEKLAAAEEEDDQERARVVEMGGSLTSIVNILDGDTATGKIHSVGDRTEGLAVANMTQVAADFLKTINRADDELAHEKVVYWLNQGAGHLCDSCKFMLEEAHRRVLIIANQKIKDRQTAGKNFEGGAGHEIKMNDEMKDEIASVCETQQYATANLDARYMCKQWMGGRHKAVVLNTFTMGSFSHEDLLKRQNTVCGDGILKVCPPKSWLGASLSPCRACAEAFQDFDRVLQNDRRDVDVGSLGVKSYKKMVEGDRKFRGKHHVWQKMQDLCSSTGQRHPAKAASVIQETCEEVVEEYESHVVRAFVEAGSKHPGAGAEEVCVNLAEKCTAEEFDSMKTSLSSWHVKKYPLTQQLHEGQPTHTEL